MQVDTDRRVAVVVGFLFIVATGASILGVVALGGALEGPEYLATLASHASSVVNAVLLYLVAAMSGAATAFLLFPILRRHDEGLAAGYVVLRVFESVFYVVGVVALLVMLDVAKSGTVGAAGDPAARLLGATLRSMYDRPIALGTMVFFGISCAMLNYMLIRSALVPRWLSGWGLVGAALVVAYGVLGVAGVNTAMGSPYMVLAMPIALQEMVFAGWLIARGLRAPEAQRGGAPDLRARALNPR